MGYSQFGHKSLKWQNGGKISHFCTFLFYRIFSQIQIFAVLRPILNSCLWVQAKFVFGNLYQSDVKCVCIEHTHRFSSVKHRLFSPFSRHFSFVHHEIWQTSWSCSNYAWNCKMMKWKVHTVSRVYVSKIWQNLV